MVVSIFSLIFAVVGLGFLIFIHELGHYWMARRNGMRVESFGIGFGRPIYTFERDGVKWNLCWIPFGGYVKIAGMEKEKDGAEPYEVKDGFFGKSPWARIQVSIMGPLANLLFALLIFSLLWLSGGREKNFSEVTKKIGWVDPQSELYKSGVRPGDEILAYDHEEVRGMKDHMQAAMLGGEVIHVTGKRYDRLAKAFVPFSVTIHPYSHPLVLEKGFLTTGVLAPASYLVYGAQLQGVPNFLPKGSPLEGSGIQYNDRIISIDGERIYSLPELSHVLNDGRVLVTIRRGKEFLLRRVPRMLVEEFKLDSNQREEIADWQWEAHLKDRKFAKLFFIPYNLNAECEVESRLSFVDQDKGESVFPKVLLSEKE
jgi:regulator of sigma E protease